MKRYNLEQTPGHSVWTLSNQNGDAKVIVNDEHLANEIHHLLQLNHKPHRQLVDLPNSTFEKIGRLIEHYSKAGAPVVTRQVILMNAIDLIHKKIFGE